MSLLFIITKINCRIKYIIPIDLLLKINIKPPEFAEEFIIFFFSLIIINI